MADHRNDLGLALAYHGVPDGPYLVLPFLGPSNVRDGMGTLADLVIDPLSLLPLTNATSDSADPTLYGLRALRILNKRADLLDAVETGKESAVDYYLFLQSAYNQYRRGQLYDGNPPDEDEGKTVTAKEQYKAKQRRLDAALIAEHDLQPSEYASENFYQ